LKNFVPLSIIHSHELQVGQKAIAIGNPFGLDHSLTVGVISALGRKIPGIGGVSIHGMIQTDASVNPGNSGGPLLDSQGRLIGLTTMIYSRSGTSSGVGFVVPADDIVRTVNQIIKHGRVQLAGFGINQVEPRIAKRLGVKQGILIGDVLANTPAAKVGLRGTHRNSWGDITLGDVLISLNDKKIPDYDTLYNLLTEIKIGDTIKITVLRNNKPVHLKLKTIDIAAYHR
jgi:S1-C subfamily serine protease